MNDIKLRELIQFIKDHEALSEIFADRVTYRFFVNEPTLTNLKIRDLDGNRKQATGEYLIEFRITAPVLEVWPFEMRKYLELIRDTFEQNHFQIWESNYYQIETLSDIWIEPNLKSQYEGVTTLIFKSTR